MVVRGVLTYILGDKVLLILLLMCFSLRKQCDFIYRCATATLPLGNSKVTVGQQQPCCWAAVNNFAVISIAFYTFFFH